MFTILSQIAKLEAFPKKIFGYQQLETVIRQLEKATLSFKRNQNANRKNLFNYVNRY